MPLIAYDHHGSILAVAHELYWVAPDGRVHAVDLETAERGQLTDLWRVSGARGSCFWPEHLGDRFTEFRVVREDRRAVRLVHRRSGAVRLRGAVDDALAAIEDTQLGAPGKRRACRRLLGDAGHPIRLDRDGRPWPEAERDAEPPPLHRSDAEADADGWEADPAGDVHEVHALLERGEDAPADDEDGDEDEHAEDDTKAGERVAH